MDCRAFQYTAIYYVEKTSSSASRFKFPSSSSSLLNSTAQVQKKNNFASKIKLNKYQQNNIDKSSDREAT